MTQLYPPIIEGTIAAVADNGTEAILTIPFLMNKAVSWNDISGFALQIKSTGLDNKILGTVYIEEITEVIKNSLELKFDLKLLGLSIGQFYKAQLAYYIKKEDKKDVGYYSAVGVFKYTNLPKVNLTRNNDEFIASFDYTNSDLTEKIYSYKFEIYYNEKIQDSSNQIIYDNNIQSLNEIKWQSNKVLQSLISYYSDFYKNNIINVRFFANTINGLQININQNFEIKNFIELDEWPDKSIALFDLNEENGYIHLETEVIDYNINNFFLVRKKNNETWQKIEENLNFKTYCYMSAAYDAIMGEYEYYSFISSEFYELGDRIEGQAGEIVDRRRLVYYDDFNIENNNEYLYGILYYTDTKMSVYIINERNKNFEKETTKEERAQAIEQNYIENLKHTPTSLNFEHSYLFNGERQLKIKYNPKVSSFKIVQLEQKTNTMGGKFPFFYTNGNVNYKEFPISGLLSYLSDEEGLFDSKYATVNLVNRDKTQSEINNWNNNIGSTQLTPENIELERQFKMEVLDFLTSGKSMLFRSPTEGNYIVRLSNVSLFPNDTLGRMLHTFSATATECAEYNEENLRELRLAIKEV